MLFATAWVNLEGIMLREINQRKILYSLTYTWNLKKLNSGTDISLVVARV